MNQAPREKVIYLRQWVGGRVCVVTSNDTRYEGILTTLAFDGNRLMYIMLDDQICLNFEHVIEVQVTR